MKMTKEERAAKYAELQNQMQEIADQEWAEMSKLQKVLQVVNVFMLVAGYVAMWYMALAGIVYGIAKICEHGESYIYKIVNKIKKVKYFISNPVSAVEADEEAADLDEEDDE